MSENLTVPGPNILLYEKLTAAKTFDLYDSGKMFLVNPGATIALTLPTLTTTDAGSAAQTEAPPGWHCEIWITEDTDGSDGGMGNIINIDFGSGNDVVGQLVTLADAAGDYAVNNDDFINFTADASPGDNVFIWTDGNRWYVRGVVKAAGSDAKFHTDAAS